jgi:hypothetical protein
MNKRTLDISNQVALFMNMPPKLTAVMLVEMVFYWFAFSVRFSLPRVAESTAATAKIPTEA